MPARKSILRPLKKEVKAWLSTTGLLLIRWFNESGICALIAFVTALCVALPRDVLDQWKDDPACLLLWKILAQFMDDQVTYGSEYVITPDQSVLVDLAKVGIYKLRKLRKEERNQGFNYEFSPRHGLSTLYYTLLKHVPPGAMVDLMPKDTVAIRQCMETSRSGFLALWPGTTLDELSSLHKDFDGTVAIIVTAFFGEKDGHSTVLLSDSRSPGYLRVCNDTVDLLQQVNMRNITALDKQIDSVNLRYIAYHNRRPRVLSRPVRPVTRKQPPKGDDHVRCQPSVPNLIRFEKFPPIVRNTNDVGYNVIQGITASLRCLDGVIQLHLDVDFVKKDGTISSRQWNGEMTPEGYRCIRFYKKTGKDRCSAKSTVVSLHFKENEVLLRKQLHKHIHCLRENLRQ